MSGFPVMFQEGYWKHGRYYGSWRHSYQFPIDAEELKRLDMLNKFFLLARRGRAFTCPVRRNVPTRVLDLGAGTGIWAILVAEEFLPVAHVMAVDLHRIQPALIPPNLSTLQFDIENRNWAPLLRNCDLVHIRLLLGSIHDGSWEATYRRAYEHTAPGGYIEQVEIDWEPQWEGTCIPENSALLEWSRKFLKGMDALQRSARVSSTEVRRMIETAGYINFGETVIRCCVSPWCDDVKEKRVACWFNACLVESIEAMGLVRWWKNAA